MQSGTEHVEQVSAGCKRPGIGFSDGPPTGEDPTANLSINERPHMACSFRAQSA
jgi:hypothetical protein